MAVLVWLVWPPDQDLRKNTVYNLYCFVSPWHLVYLSWQLLGCCLNHLITISGCWLSLVCGDQKGIAPHVISIYIDFKAISTCMLCLRHNLHCFTENGPVTLETQSRSFVARNAKDLYKRQLGSVMKSVCVFLPEKFNVHCVTKNSPVTFNTRSRSPMTDIVWISGPHKNFCMRYWNYTVLLK